MNKCSDECNPVCDFCKHFIHMYEDKEMTGEGWCSIKEKIIPLSGYCDSFYCFNVDKK